MTFIAAITVIVQEDILSLCRLTAHHNSTEIPLFSPRSLSVMPRPAGVSPRFADAAVDVC
jgi:hypothetical protein